MILGGDVVPDTVKRSCAHNNGTHAEVLACVPVVIGVADKDALVGGNATFCQKAYRAVKDPRVGFLVLDRVRRSNMDEVMIELLVLQDAIE